MNKIVYFLLPLLISCGQSKVGYVEVVKNDTKIDSLFISDNLTNRKIKVVSATGSTILDVDSTTIATIKTRNGKGTYLTIIHPDKNLEISIKKDSTLSTNQLADSLMNYLWHSQNAFLGEHGNLIFTSNDTDSLLSLYTSFGENRASTIEQFSEQLTIEDKALLHYQNTARLNSFLLYYGKFIKKIPLGSDYYRFIQAIEDNNPLTKTLPHNLIRKHEINYLNEKDSISSITLFLSYIELQTQRTDLADYLKATYLREIIEDPSEWQHHQSLLIPSEIQSILKQEKDNAYLHLIESSTDSYFSSLKGKKAYDFTAVRPNGTLLKLSDLRGKLVFIDNWATWCGPCLKHRPFVLEMVEKYKDNSNIEILMISVDASKESWENYLIKKDQFDNGNDLIIENGMNDTYGERFNIKSIPKYMLIDPNGMIIDADLPDPSNNLMELLDNRLEQM